MANLLIGVVVVIALLVLGYAIADLVQRRDIGGGLNTLWGVIIFVLPIIGAILYFALRPAGRGHKSLGRPPSI
jgi:hypothetical protein